MDALKRVEQLDQMDLEALMRGTIVGATLVGGLDGSPPEDIHLNELDFEYDIFRFREKLINFLRGELP